MLKRCFDLFFGVFALIVFSPLLLILAVLIKWDSPGPIFYRGVRTGRHGKPFRIYKFRTMVPDAESSGGPSTALNDPRITRVGQFLRKYKFDELPQLINIVLGEMSFVGPRPQVERYTRIYTPEEQIILSVRPGLTDYASIHFIHLDAILGNEDVDEKYLREVEPEKNRLRIQYARNPSFRTDMKILYLTLCRMLKIRSLWNSES
ncbi:MAG: sugar transferase [Deltaproteobacteria bacterium]|nr:sugar transferase [Deltaproteobacteria bacterium]